MGAQIKKAGQSIIVPEDPIIHYIEGDGIGIDITPVMIRVVDNSVEKAYSGTRKIAVSYTHLRAHET